MRHITYRITYSGVLQPGGSIIANPEMEQVTVTARDINSGFTKALKRAQEKLGNGNRREITSVEFWQAI